MSLERNLNPAVLMAPGLGKCILTVEKTAWSNVARVTQWYNTREWRWLDSWYAWTGTFKAETPAPTRKSYIYIYIYM